MINGMVPPTCTGYAGESGAASTKQPACCSEVQSTSVFAVFDRVIRPDVCGRRRLALALGISVAQVDEFKTQMREVRVNRLRLRAAVACIRQPIHLYA